MFRKILSQTHLSRVAQRHSPCASRRLVASHGLPVVTNSVCVSTTGGPRRFFSKQKKTDNENKEKEKEKENTNKALNKNDNENDPTLAPPTVSDAHTTKESERETHTNTQPDTQTQTQEEIARIAEDRKLALSYEGLWPRVLKSFELLNNDSLRQEFDRLVSDKVIQTEEWFIGSNLFIELQHPLLKKYAFDPADFLAGAKEAFLQTRRAVAALELNDAIHSEHSAELIAEAFNPPFLIAFNRVMKHEGKPRNHVVLKDLKVESVLMKTVSTEIVDEKFYAYEEKLYRQLLLRALDSLMMAQDADKDTWLRTEKEWLDSFAVERIYPMGSVVATAEVSFDTAEDVVEIQGLGVEAKEVETIHHKRNTMVFQACLSGQVPLNWMVHSTFVEKKPNKK